MRPSIIIYLIFSLFYSPFITKAQVHVRGYYRSNGTYVRPHERTRPNHTVTDNYSYPGNFNPNVGQVTGGNEAQSSGNSPISFPKETVYNYGSSSSSASALRYAFSQPIQHELLIEAALRENYVETSRVIKSIPKGAIITLIGKDYDSYRATYESATGYLFYKNVDKDYKSFLSSNILSIAGNSQTAQESEPPVIHYKYFTKLRLDSPLRSQPISSSTMVYEIPAGSIVQLGIYNDNYWYAQGNGYEGYLGAAYVETTTQDSSSFTISRQETQNYSLPASSAYIRHSQNSLKIETPSSYYIRSPRGGCYYLTQAICGS